MKPNTIDRAVSNTDFAKRVGVHYTMASRIRNGRRMPSSHTLSSICSAFNLHGSDQEEMMLAVQEGQSAFGQWVRAKLFIPHAEDD